MTARPSFEELISVPRRLHLDHDPMMVEQRTVAILAQCAALVDELMVAAEAKLAELIAIRDAPPRLCVVCGGVLEPKQQTTCGRRCSSVNANRVKAEKLAI